MVQIHITDKSELYGFRVAGLVYDLNDAGYRARLRSTMRPWVILVAGWEEPGPATALHEVPQGE